MASVFKRKRRVKLPSGKTATRQSAKWHVKYIDAEGIEQRVPGFKDKAATQQLAAKLEREAEMAKAGVVDRYKGHRKRPLAEHLEDFRQSLLAKGNTVKHADQSAYRVKQIIGGCRFAFWSDIQPSKVQRYLAELRNGQECMSAQTSNYYLKSIKQFTKWMVQDGRASESLLEHLRTVNTHTDIRRERRALEPDEIRHLLETTAASPERFGMSGCQRAMLYRLAVETGLRASELRSLTVSSFDLDRCTVTVKAAYSKHRRQDELPLRADTAAALKELFVGNLPSSQAFNIPGKPAKMLKTDLAEAGIDYVDGSGRVFDFHALRGQCASLLASTGVHPRVAQSIMRHCDINLTMSRYTHVLSGQESEAVAGLPDLSAPSRDAQKALATGTDGKAVDTGEGSSEELTPKLTPAAYSGCNRLAAVDNERRNVKESITDDNCLDDGNLDSNRDDLSSVVIGEKETRPGGLEPPTFGFEVRDSIQLSYGRKSLSWLGLYHTLPSL